MSKTEGIILFDMSRLVSRFNEATATGIDRVDIRYAKYLSDRFGDKCVFVVQQHGKMYLYGSRDAGKAINNLWDRWISGKSLQETRTKVPKFAAPRFGFGADPSEEGRRSNGFRKEDIEFLFDLSYSDRVKFVMTKDLEPYVPDSLLWFLHFPAFIKFPVVLVCVSRVSVFGFLTRLGKALHAGMGVLRKGIGRMSQLAGNLTAAGKLRKAWRESRSHFEPKLAEVLDRYLHSRITLVNTSHHGLGSRDLFFELRSEYRADFVFFIHDIIPILFPEYVRADTVSAHHKRMQTIAEFRPFLIVNSSETQKTINAYFSGRNWPQPRSDVALIGVEDKFLSECPDAGPAKGPNHFVMLGTIEPRKNHLLILNLWRDLVESRTPNMPKLFVIGRRGWENENIIHMLDRCPAVRDHVIELSGVSDQTVSGILKSARALLFPSFVEGWGMPVVEALSMGVPVICSDIPVLHEAGQDVPDYIHPLDFTTWRETILSYNEANSPQRARQLKRLESYRAPRWHEHWSALETALGPCEGSTAHAVR
ncbi:glycosyltransferase family 4 protein [Roseibium sp. Sym1]|uniref:glycosyltransferase family 4 protein n=1 Tax=Roseibium sp. Sym1 TaxID=3016006 RepID=UPI0022B2B8D6|nr:glycosyltransferase family 1 protein [Roseibium sp. Sym1]